MIIRKLLGALYIQVIIAIVLGVLIGNYWPQVGIDLKPLGDGFIKLIKMVIGPIIFCTVVCGITSMHDVKQVGRVGGKALLYFEIVSSIALLIGLLAAHALHPGVGFNVDVKTLDTSAISGFVGQAEHGEGITGFLLHVIPTTFFDAFSKGEILPVLFVAVLFALGLVMIGEKGRPLVGVINQASDVFFRIVGMITRVAPIGAFGAIAFTIGKYGLASLLPLLKLVGTFYLTAFIFVVCVLGSIARYAGFSIFRLLTYIKSELLIVLGTSSSESALPQLMNNLERLGCSKGVVGIVVPTGYTFNLDGTNIYMTLAVLFLAQATNIDLTLEQQLTLLAVAMLTSKGAGAVVGAGFVALAASLAVVPTVPVATMVLILGVDRFMAECRSLTNIIGNAVATLVVAAWEGELDRSKMEPIALKRGRAALAAAPAKVSVE
ncbi:MULTISPECIES: C4-dicarboxylate transporter DctA [unclassified Pseudomonas]|uniref:C4-dicarboxylate transporter DctA n=1 Tax=unclassified Pseudomonas TaxID=196821 RepID=UPI00119B724D|nr:MULTISPECIES: C4-dicarboxylate transporter DctA [unclassified Pseudomonas]TWC20500.1 aerobic C4-dicarboxylate transport protein [Pseudomonas sp. SJZ075]TWC25620.1 aerobic C4-dicarboxylate transport protein [Pseudomonas sp. SJZ074]TWC35930.1 aerobic C4-dicarboxylate transport protein [Pseudomonas sp. SJZ078]TWC42431.1 aerobic C4-dicarboxylate transport protein [Pseudomonas sp. SJZ085]TWC56798.1 aerobic C4-dicarboxylate transport protein [Pseudomonas sp. SJZ124]